jgi:hypothetical protein
MGAFKMKPERARQAEAVESRMTRIVIVLGIAAVWAFILSTDANATLEGTTWAGQAELSFPFLPGAPIGCGTGTVTFQEGQVRVRADEFGLDMAAGYTEWPCGTNDCFLILHHEPGWMISTGALLLGKANGRALGAIGLVRYDIGGWGGTYFIEIPAIREEGK